MGTAKRERQKANRQQRLEQMAKQSRQSKTRKRLIQVAVIVPVLVLLAVLVIYLTADDDSGTDTVTPGTEAPTGFSFGTGPCPPETKPAEPIRTFTDAPQQCIDLDGTYTAEVTTNKGSFTIALDTAASPGTVNNFVTLARYGYYDGTGCHRIVEDFVVQCGRPGDDETAPGYTIPDELPTAPYEIGMVAMANTGAPDSGGGQWFVITGENGAALPPSYSVVGRVTEGMDTTIAALTELAAPDGEPPTEPVDITSVEITEGAATPSTEPTSTEPASTEPASTEPPAATDAPTTTAP